MTLEQTEQLLFRCSERKENNTTIISTKVPAASKPRKTTTIATTTATTRATAEATTAAATSRVFSETTIAASEQNLRSKINYLKIPRILESPCWNKPCQNNIKGVSCCRHQIDRFLIKFIILNGLE